MSLVRNPGAIPLPTAADKGANFYCEISFADFIGSSAGAVALALFTVLGNAQGLELHHTELITPFANSADGAFVSTAVTVGDAGSANRHLVSTEFCLNGTFVNLAFGTGTKYAPAANTVVTATFTPTATKNLANLTQGKLALYFRVNDARQFEGLN